MEWTLEAISFIACWHDEAILQKYLHPSLPLCHPDDEVLLIQGADSLSAGYAAGEAKAKNRLLAFLHSDLRLSPGWREHLMAQIALIERCDREWGLLGLFGAKWHMDQEHLTGITTYGNVVDTQASWVCHQEQLPAKVHALDSIALIKRKGTPLFDAKVPTFQGAAEDVCYACNASGRSIYVIDAPAEHFSSQASCAEYEQDLQTAAAYLVKKWNNHIWSTTKLWEYSIALMTGETYEQVNQRLDGGLVPVPNMKGVMR